MDKVLLIDYCNFAWRANNVFKPSAKVDPAYAFPATQVSDEYVMVYQFFRNLKALIAQFIPDKCFVVLEGHPQFRYDLFPEYKANRIIKVASTSKSEANERFEKSSPEIIRLLKHLPLSIVRAAKYEADDLIATLVEDMREEEVIIASGDTDFIQLLQKGYTNVKVYSPVKKEFMTAPEAHYLALKSLRGDKSDNIKGLVGEKTALKLVSNPDKLEAFLELEENRSLFNINMELIQLRQVPSEEIEIEEGVINFEALKEEFSKMLLPSMLKEPYWTNFCETFKEMEL